MKTRAKSVLLLMAALLGSVLCAPAQQDQTTNPSPPAMTESNQANMRWMQHMEEMDTMAKSMTSMAEMCRTMMEKEMRQFPVKITAIVAIGSLLTIALLLFVVLEIQWIRFWNIRIKTERMKLTAQKS